MTRKLLYNCMSIYDISYHLWNIDGQFLFKTRLFLHCIIRIRKNSLICEATKATCPWGIEILKCSACPLASYLKKNDMPVQNPTCPVVDFI